MPTFILTRLGRFLALTCLALTSLAILPGCVTDPENEAALSCDGESAVVAHVSSALSQISCGERSDTGYTSGSPTAITVVTVDGKAVERRTANAYLVMAQAASRDGVEIRVVSGFRTQSEQQRLYNCYRNCNCNSCNLAARPGYSNHQSGHALDLNSSAAGVMTWLNRNAGRFGFQRTVPSEPWHWEWWGGGPGGGPCGAGGSGGGGGGDNGTGGVEAPACGSVPEAGGLIEESSACFSAKGPAQYWRKVDAGHGGRLMWTNAFRSATPSNWARWTLNMASAGRYGVEIWAEEGYALYDAARYVVVHGGVQHTVTVDLSAASGWVPLGIFDFDGGAGQHVSVYDNVSGAVAAGQRIPADALRVTLVQSATPVTHDADTDEGLSELPGVEADSAASGGVAVDPAAKAAVMPDGLSPFDSEKESAPTLLESGASGNDYDVPGQAGALETTGGCSTSGSPAAAGLPLLALYGLLLLRRRR